MKRTIWAAVALLASTSLADAADVPDVPSFDWTGAYVGLSAGYAFSDNKVNVENIGSSDFPQAVLNNLGTNTFDLDPDGFVGGAQIGYNWQTDRIVLGIEADAQYTDVNGSDTVTNGSQGFRGHQELDFLATLRARLGVVFSAGFLYATGGLAVGDVDLDADLTNDNFGGDDWINGGSSTEWGWTVGAGGEFMLTDNISVKAEYLYVDLGDESFSASGVLPGEDVEFEFENQFHIVRAGLNWHF